MTRLTDAEITWRDQQVAAARLIADHYTGDSEDLPSLERLDASVAAWQADGETRIDVNTLVNAVGIAFGAHLAAATGLEWRIAEDDDGTDLALYGRRGDVLIFPANAVAKRIAAGDRAFVKALHDAVVGGATRVG